MTLMKGAQRGLREMKSLGIYLEEDKEELDKLDVRERGENNEKSKITLVILIFTAT